MVHMALFCFVYVVLMKFGIFHILSIVKCLGVMYQNGTMVFYFLIRLFITLLSCSCTNFHGIAITLFMDIV